MYNTNRGNKRIGNRYNTHNTESYKPIDMNANPSINAYKHHIAYIRNGHKASPIPTPPTDDN